MDSQSNSNEGGWTTYHGDRRARRQQEFPSAFGGQRREGGGERREGNFGAFGGGQRRGGGEGGDRRQFPNAFNRRGGGAGGRREPEMYSREWHEQQRRAQEQDVQRAAEVAEKSREVNDVNFPELVSSFAGAGAAPPKSKWAQQGSELARAWSEEQRIREEMDRARRAATEEREFRQSMFERSVVPIPMRSNTAGGFNRAAYEDDEENLRVYRDEEAPSRAAGAGEEEEWTTVDNSKKRKPVHRSGMWHHLTEFESPPADESVWGGGGGGGGAEEEDSVW